MAKFLHASDGLTVHLNDDVPRLQSGFVPWSAYCHLGNQHACTLRDAKVFCELRGKVVAGNSKRDAMTSRRGKNFGKEHGTRILKFIVVVEVDVIVGSLQLRAQDTRFPVPNNLDRHGAAGGSFANQPPQLGAAAHVDAIEFHDGITGFEAGLGRGAVLLNTVDDCSGNGWQFQRLRFLRRHIPQRDAQVDRPVVENKHFWCVRRLTGVREFRQIGHLRKIGRFGRFRRSLRRRRWNGSSLSVQNDSTGN